MGRTVIADEAGVHTYAQRLTTSKEQVGLLIGLSTATDDCDFLVGLIPTPLPEVTASGGGAKKKKQLSPVDVLDAEWMSEHAHQVNRMLPGGLAIVGAYLYASSSASSAFLPKMHQLLYSIREAAGHRGKQGGPSELLLLQIASDTKKYTAQSIDITNRRGDSRSAEFAFQSFVSSLQCFVCVVDVDLSVALGSGQRQREQIEAALNREVAALRDGVALIDRAVVDDEAPICGGGGGKKKAGKPGKRLPDYAVHTVELFTEGFASSSVAADGALGTFALSGEIQGRAYCHPNASFGAAVAAVKADLAKSLAARFDFVCEELDRREADLQEAGDKQKNKSADVFNPFGEAAQQRVPKFEQQWGLPQRVFFPFVKPVLLGDYLLPFETIREDCCERAKALLDLQPAEQDFVTPERFVSEDLTVELCSTQQSAPTRKKKVNTTKEGTTGKETQKKKQPANEDEDGKEEAEKGDKVAALASTRPAPGSKMLAAQPLAQQQPQQGGVPPLALAGIAAVLALVLAFFMGLL